MKEINQEKILFVCEQNGEIENTFKSELIKIFLRYEKLISAYLVRAQYDNDPELYVVLCLKYLDDNHENILQECFKVFQSMFSKNISLDMLFISDEQEQQLNLICNPFYLNPSFNNPKSV